MSERLLHALANPLVGLILRSPLHGLMSHNTLLVTVTGRKSGKRFTLPVNYVRKGDSLLVISRRYRPWWKNLRGGGPVEVRLQGRVLRGQPGVTEDPARVAAALRTYLGDQPGLARYVGVPLGPGTQPRAEDVVQAATTRVVIEITLQPWSSSP